MCGRSFRVGILLTTGVIFCWCLRVHDDFMVWLRMSFLCESESLTHSYWAGRAFARWLVFSGSAGASPLPCPAMAMVLRDVVVLLPFLAEIAKDCRRRVVRPFVCDFICSAWWVSLWRKQTGVAHILTFSGACSRPMILVQRTTGQDIINLNGKLQTIHEGV